MGSYKYHPELLPKFGKQALKGIVDLDKMDLQCGAIYKGNDGSERKVTKTAYPLKCICKHTTFSGALRVDETTNEVIDTRRYHTPNDGGKTGICLIDVMITSDSGTVSHIRESVPDFVKWLGWDGESPILPVKAKPTGNDSMDNMSKVLLANAKTQGAAGIVVHGQDISPEEANEGRSVDTMKSNQFKGTTKIK